MRFASTQTYMYMPNVGKGRFATFEKNPQKHIIKMSGQGEAILASLFDEVSYEPYQKGLTTESELATVPKIYRISRSLERSQLIHLIAATVLFGISLSLLILSIILPAVSNLAPWFFWLIPTMGSFGVALGIMLNFYSSGILD